MRGTLGLVILFSTLNCLCHGQVRIIKTWRGAASEGKKAVMAVRTAGAMESCEWSKGKERYSSEDDERDYEVTLEMDDTLCKLLINKAEEREHAGRWDVVVYGPCDDVEDNKRRRRRKRQAVVGDRTNPVNFPGQSETSPNGGRVVVSNLNRGGGTSSSIGGGDVRFRRTDAQRDQFSLKYNHRVRSTGSNKKNSRNTKSSGSECGSMDEATDIELEIDDEDTLVAVAGQDTVYGYKDGKNDVVLTVRSNDKVDNCEVKFGRGNSVSLRNGRDNCDDNFKRKYEVCVENFQSRPDGLYACNIKIKDFDEDLEGTWEVTVEREINRRKKSKTFEIEAEYIELPDKVILLHDGDEFGEQDQLEPEDLSEVQVQCEVEGGKPEPEVELYLGTQRLEDAKEKSCKAKGRGNSCTEFEFDADDDDNDGLFLTCVANVPGMDYFAEEDLLAFTEFRTSGGNSNGKGNKPKLVDGKRGRITVCADDYEEGDEFEMEIEFESEDKPSKIEWQMQVEEGRKTVVREGRSSRGYTSYELEEKRRDRYVAAMKIDELDGDDIDVKNNHALVVTTGRNDDETEFLVTIDTSRNCDGGSGKDFECDVEDDRDCRCDKRGSKCCDASRGCDGDHCCLECEDEDDDDCDLCNRRGRDCMTLEEKKGDKDKPCKEGDKNCQCVELEDDTEFCCDKSSRCQGKYCCEECDEDEQDCVCDRKGRNCVIVKGDSKKDLEDKAKDIMLESCLEMSALMLEYWTAEGEKRKSSTSERKFKENLEDFFTTAKCTKFDDDIQGYYDDPDRKRVRSSPLQRGKDGSFLAFRGGVTGGGISKVERVAAATNPVPDADLLSQAQAVVDQAKEAL